MRLMTSLHIGPFELEARYRLASTSYRTHFLSPGVSVEEDEADAFSA